MSGRELAGLAVAIIVCFAAAAVGGLFTSRSVSTWYTDIAKPSWTPPSGVFGPVWTVLYLAMAIAAWLVWRSGAPGSGAALTLFAVQLLLNVAWSALFFGARMPGAAFVEIVLLWGAILATTVLFFRVQPAAGWLMLPYLAWVSFASALNYAIWRMNA